MQIDRVLRLYLFENLIHEGDIIDVLPIGLSHLVFAAIVPIPSKRLGKDGNEMIGLGDSVKVGQINNGRGAMASLLGAAENEDNRNRFLQESRYEHSKGTILSPQRQRGVTKSSGLECHWGEQKMNKQDSRPEKRSPRYAHQIPTMQSIRSALAEHNIDPGSGCEQGREQVPQKRAKTEF